MTTIPVPLPITNFAPAAGLKVLVPNLKDRHVANPSSPRNCPCPGQDSNLHAPEGTAVFKTAAYARFATRAGIRGVQDTESTFGPPLALSTPVVSNLRCPNPRDPGRPRT